MERSAKRGSHRAGAIRIVQLLALAALYFLGGRLGLGLAREQANTTLVWPPTGLSIAALILYGRGLWPGVFAGAFLLNVSMGLPLSVAGGIATGNTLEAVLAATFLRRVAGFRPSLERIGDVVAFLLIGAVASPAVSATIGPLSLQLAGLLHGTSYSSLWSTWWLGDMGGAIVLAPFLLLARHGRPTWSALLRRLESWLVFLGLGTGASLAFGGALAGPWALLAAFVPFPFLVWAGCRLGPRGAVLASALTAVIATAGTAFGRGPFIASGAHQSLMLLWGYVIASSTAALTLAAAIAERELAERERERGEASRLELERRVSQAQRLESLGVLAGGVAHDFNNILVAIRGNAELLRTKLSAKSEEKEMLAQIEEATGRAAELCRNLMTFAGRKSPGKRSVLLTRLIEETLDLVRPSLPRKVDVVCRFDRSTPPVLGDATQLRQVLMNLVLNAAESYRERPGEVLVRLGAVELDEGDLARMTQPTQARPGPFARVEVVDRGMGMDAETLGRVFDPFFTTKFTGRGLGLAAVLGIVASHGGALEVESTVGAGTVFRVFLPASANEPEREVPRPQVEPPAGAGRLVLVADDEPSVRRVVRITLERAGYRVLTAADGGAALACFREHPKGIDAVLLDVTMPVRSGDEVLREIRALDPGVPVLLMSGYQPPPSPAGGGPDGFLHKPFAGREVLERIGRALLEPRAAAPRHAGAREGATESASLP